MEKIISGGQSGVDRAALDVAIELEIPCGGWCPKGRKAEDGDIPLAYPLQETPSFDYRVRTEWNVRDSDGTLVLTIGEPTGGTAATIEFAATQRKPCLVVDLSDNPSPESVKRWIEQYAINNLNVAGPRQSGVPGIHEKAVSFLKRCLVDKAATA